MATVEQILNFVTIGLHATQIMIVLGMNVVPNTGIVELDQNIAQMERHYLLYQLLLKNQKFVPRILIATNK